VLRVLGQPEEKVPFRKQRLISPDVIGVSIVCSLPYCDGETPNCDLRVVTLEIIETAH